MGKLDGKVALITGAASGIGKAAALLLAREGARIAVTDINAAAGAACVAEIGEGRAFFYRHDVADEAQWIAALGETQRRFGRLDVLVNNAGMAIAGDITQLSLADWRRQQGVNLEGVFLGIKHALPMIRTAGGGAIINISSTTGISGSASLVSYSATKAGVRVLTKSVALQCARMKDGVRVNAIHPGIIETPIYGAIEGPAPIAADGVKPLARDPEALAKLVVPLGYPGTPEDIAAGVLYLASDDARYVTGADLVIDGGALAG